MLGEFRAYLRFSETLLGIRRLHQAIKFEAERVGCSLISFVSGKISSDYAPEGSRGKKVNVISSQFTYTISLFIAVKPPNVRQYLFGTKPIDVV